MKTMKQLLILSLCLAAFAVRGQETLSLDAIVSKVLEQNFDVRLERNNLSIAEYNNNIGNAGYLPTIGVAADQNWSSNNTRQEFFSGQVNQAKGAKNRSTNAAVELNWTFFDGFRMFATDHRLQYQEDYAGLQLTAEMEMAVYRAAVIYYTILQQQELLPVYEDALDLSKARFDLVEIKQKNGAATQLQLIQARLDLTADSSVLLQQQKLLADLKVDLNTVLGQPASTPIAVSGQLVPEASLTWESALSAANQQNTQLLAAKAAIAIAEMQKKEVQSLYYPQLSFYARYSYSTQQNQVGLLNSSRTLGPGAGFTLTWNILDRLSTYTSLKTTNLTIQSAEIVAEQQQFLIESELSKAFTEYNWARANLELEQQNIVNAEETFSIAENSFKNGSMTALELREIQFSVTQAQSRLLSAQLALKTAELNIALSTGNFKRLLQ